MQADFSTRPIGPATRSRPRSRGAGLDFQDSLHGLFRPHASERYCPACDRHTAHERRVPPKQAFAIGAALLAGCIAAGIGIGTLLTDSLGALAFILMMILGRQWALPAFVSRYPHICKRCRPWRDELRRPMPDNLLEPITARAPAASYVAIRKRVVAGRVRAR